ncbi:MAG: hypothetical protein S4CHLAM37_05730 [Chlamydiia bacterium]|nr:hypothetical protein [Chlamydiia bacterium]
MSKKSKIKHKSILIITTSGGGGHLQAARAKYLDEKSKNPHVKIKVKDLLKEAGGKAFGRFMINVWDVAQRKGCVRTLEFWVNNVPIFDVLFGIPVFFQILYRLFRNDVDHVIDTQPLCLSSIVGAVRLYRFFSKKTVVIEKFLTELPTNYATHYLKPIKKLRKKNRGLVKLVTTEPLLSDNETAESFWQKYCGLSESFISYGDFPIRPNFKKFQNKKLHKDTFPLHIRLKSPEEKSYFKDVLKKGGTKATIKNDNLQINIEPSWKITTLMLGSQPTQEATLQYVKNFIDVINHESTKNKKHVFFVFCSKKKFEDVPLQKRIHELVMNMKDYPENLTIIPMSSQDDDVIAPLYFRSDATVTKAGGVTAMELIAAARGKIWIHHENTFNPFEKLLFDNPFFTLSSYKGMPKWEYGNATYLGEMKGAQMVTPETFLQASRTFLSSG